MAANRCTYQQTYTVSIPKRELMNYIVLNDELNKKELRVCLYLFTVLDGWQNSSSGRSKDPENFKKIQASNIAKDLGYNKKDVKKVLDTLIDYGILEEGDSNGTNNGLRFCF